VAQPNKDEPTQADRQGERKVTIVGNPEAQWKAQFMIFRKVGYESFSGPQGPQEATLRVEIMIPSNQVGRIIGKGGTVVREMQRNTRATIKLPEESSSETEETPVHIIGDFLSTQAAQRQIRALVSRTTVPSVQKTTTTKVKESRQTNHHSDQQQSQQQSQPQQHPPQSQSSPEPLQ
jgi:insulin-like growth factor 2 mRNA-binding protein 1